MGRPPIEGKKVRYQLMVDPDYLTYFKKMADKVGIPHQELGRMALTHLVPDPKNPYPLPPAFLKKLLGREHK